MSISFERVETQWGLLISRRMVSVSLTQTELPAGKSRIYCLIICDSVVFCNIEFIENGNECGSISLTLDGGLLLLYWPNPELDELSWPFWQFDKVTNSICTSSEKDNAGSIDPNLKYYV